LTVYRCAGLDGERAAGNRAARAVVAAVAAQRRSAR
jgi:hypothetical protein